jgi:predicted acetyltransferase
MNFQLIFATPDYKDVIENLMQFYTYDFSEYVDLDVEENGLFKAYSGLEEYWKEGADKFPYIIKRDEKYIGFVLIKTEESEKNYYSIVEFFIMRKYRREGIATEVAKQLFSVYKGRWKVHQRENNIPAQQFWIKVIDEYTDGQFSERYENGRRIQDFRT